MKLSRISIGSIMLILLFSACKTLYIHEISKNPNTTLNQNDSISILIIGIDDVIINEFNKSFNKKYSDNKAYVNNYIQNFSDRLRNENIFINFSTDKSTQWDLKNSLIFSKDQTKSIDSLINISHEDYLLKISNINISNRKQTVPNAIGFGPNLMKTTSFIEFCIVRSRIELIDMKTKEIVLEFVSIGEGRVFLYAFQAALEDAQIHSIDHAIAYLKTGITNF